MVKQETTESQLVVIGSSAGGIEALSRVVASLPADFPAPIVIAQHLDPRRPSHLGEILARQATLPIKVVEKTAALEDGVIFVVPSNSLVEIVDHELRLRPARPGSDRAVGRPAARDGGDGVSGPGLTAVILTGSGSDGAAGAWHVKQAGGAVVIENPATAMFPSMPRSISPSLVDATADLDAIGGGPARPAGGRRSRARRAARARSSRRCSSGSGSGAASTSAPTRPRRSSAGCAAGWARRDTRTLAGYAKQLETDPEEYARLISSLLIKVTEFFRDPKVFDHLRDHVLPALIEDARAATAGSCASGRPAARRARRPTRSRSRCSEAIGRRRAASTCASSPPTSIGDGDRLRPPRALPAGGAPERPAAPARPLLHAGPTAATRSCKSLRSLMIFGEHDLGARAPFPRIDLILCRNVLIYFNPPMQRAALETFGFSLRDDGRLVLGPSETVAAMPGAFVEDTRPAADLPPRARARRRCRWRTAKTPSRPPRDLEAPLETAIRATRRDVQVAADSTEAAEALLLDLGLGVVVVDARYYITRINTAARRMLGIHGRAFDQDFIHLAESLPSTADPGRDRRRAHGQDDRRPSTRSSRPTSRPMAPRFIQTVVRPYVRQSGDRSRARSSS